MIKYDKCEPEKCLMLKDETQRADQLGTNCRWLVSQMDKIHAVLCPGHIDSWQERVIKTVETVEHKDTKNVGHGERVVQRDMEQTMMIKGADTPQPPKVDLLSPMAEKLLGLLQRFYAVWNRCESTRGCYACAEPHDCRCEKERGISEVCNCGRDELEALEFAIDNIGEPCAPQPAPVAGEDMGWGN